MADELNLFPQRAAIGRVDASGAVYMTPEFTRALGQLLVRVGGTSALSNADLAIDGVETAAAVLAVQNAVIAELLLQVGTLTSHLALLDTARKQLEALELAGVNVSAPTDWEHPGKVGASTPNSGKFTTLTATDKVQLNPAAKDVEIKPTGAQLLTIQPANAGQIDNMELGKTTPQPARVSKLNLVTITQPATGATLTLADGATLTVPGTGGTLGSAAYQSTNAFAARSGTALAPAATDAASTQTLANSLRAVLLSVGIGS